MKWINGFIFFITIASYSQDTKFVLKKNKDFNEEYYVLTTGNKIKNGTYVKYTNSYGNISLLETGSYLQGEKNGLWETYYHIPYTPFGKNIHNNSLKERTHFANGKKNGLWVSFYLDTIANNASTQKYGSKRRADSLNVSIEQNGLRPRLAGQFLNDKRVGEWLAFDFGGNICQRYNFTTSKLTLDSSLKDSLAYNQNRGPLYIGGTPCLIDFLVHEFSLKGIAEVIKKDSSTVIIQFSIDPTGKISDPKIYDSNGPALLEKEALRLVPLLENNWIPALQNGQAATSDYKIAFDVTQNVMTDRFKSFKIILRPIIE